MNIKAFTLIELVVGITISMMLMISVGIFVNNGMANILTQQKVIENTTEFTDYISQIHSAINLMSSGTFQPVKTASGIIFKREQNLGEGGFSYIGTGSYDEIYCESGSEKTKTTHLILKTFIPFEEKDEDIFDDYENSLTGSSFPYTSYQKQHIIKKGNNIIVGKGIFGNKFEEGASGTGIYLNSPTGLAYINSKNLLFISDTLNNRILYLSGGTTIHKLLDESDGLNEPTGLYYNDNSLYISNSGNGEILKYYSKSETDKKINISFSIDKDIDNVKKIEITFFSGVTDITEPNSISDFDITGITTSTDYFTGSNNEITYWFTNFGDNYYTQDNQPCSGTYTKYYEESGDIIKEEITHCSGTGTIKKYKTNLVIDKNDGDTITIETNIDTNGHNFSNNGNYYIKLELIGDETYSKYFPLFTESDNDLTTPNDNILEIIYSNLNYPTGIWGDGNTDFNEFGKSGRDFNKTLDNHPSDIILKTPINYLNTYIDNGLVTFLLKYYKKYNCYNLDDKTERTYLIKKNLK